MPLLEAKQLLDLMRMFLDSKSTMCGLGNLSSAGSAKVYWIQTGFKN